MYKKENLLFLLLGGFFITNALLAEFIGVKIFSLEQTLGWEPANISLFGIDGLAFNMTAGVLLWPIVFIMTDIINEYYGKRGVRLLSYMAVGLIIYAYFMVLFAIRVTPAEFWLGINSDISPSIDVAFSRIFGQGLWIIAGSLIAFLIGQIVDVSVFQYLRRFTGAQKIWFRATGSTLVSQLIDSFVVLFVAFYIGPESSLKWPLNQVFAVAIVNYIYKFSMAILLTPFLYVIHGVIDRYLGKDRAHLLMEQAASG
ncbi:MAG: queuosine precursor transporter [Bacteroidota bacterium]